MFLYALNKKEDQGEKDCEGKTSHHYKLLQERFNALTRDHDLCKNRNTELNNRIRNIEDDRNRLEILGELSDVLPQACPPGWTEINSRCYFLSTEQKTWEESRKDCQSKDADLVVINSEQEMRSLYGLDGDSLVQFWIGLYKPTGTVGWNWVDGSKLTQLFSQAVQLDFNRSKRKECVEMFNYSSWPARWRNLSCNTRLPSLCEKGVNY
ncbi:C-type lectin domain family 4 member A-like isoform X2 [Eleginops maclovinus]|uniref:C-type lectin domain family 4 member A-like isoform X2 n=1 Tax=Eleginops maclovinus TaxID=56733 RepID=UPI003080E292